LLNEPNISQQTIATRLVYLTLILSVFPRLFTDAVQFCSKFAVLSLCRKKLSSGSHKVSLSENRTDGVICFYTHLTILYIHLYFTTNGRQ